MFTGFDSLSVKPLIVLSVTRFYFFKKTLDQIIGVIGSVVPGLDRVKDSVLDEF